MRHDLNETIVRLCVLDDPARWAAYLALRTAGRPLTRAEVADEVGISARLAAFHFEKLVSEGFLEATYERDERSARVGHPAKRYRPTGLELEVSIPPRRYDLAAEILAEALEADFPDPPLESLADIAAEYGRQVGMRPRSNPTASCSPPPKGGWLHRSNWGRFVWDRAAADIADAAAVQLASSPTSATAWSRVSKPPRRTHPCDRVAEPVWETSRFHGRECSTPDRIRRVD